MTTAYPLAWPEGWPRTPAHKRGRAPFGNVWDRAKADLYKEVGWAGAKSCVVSSNLALRIDGTPRGDQVTAFIPDPGVAVYFSKNDRPMVLAQDRYRTVLENVRAITLALRYLRGLERHGGAHMMERAFGGFAQLPPPKNGAAPDEKPWREVLGPLPDGLDKPDMLVLAESRYRKRAAESHADVGGSNEAMILLNAAIARAREELRA